ncbi:MAG: hypothetical protein ACI89X_003101 [Planctomycetota bacterium]|jgi:uncharacterized protein (TIGR01777 family)
MRIAITGSTGLVGKALIPALQNAGHRVVRLVRCDAIAPHRSAEDAVQWQPATGAIDLDALGAIDAVVHLAGENVASGRWTKARKQRISDSRGPTTEKLCRTLAGMARPPHTFISASGINIYGDRGAEELHEGSSLASEPDFLADVAKAWELGAQPLADSNTRVVHLRIGIVLDRTGGALARMLLPFRLGIGGRLGNGHHWMSWITLPDLVRVVQRALIDEELRGPVNAIAPVAVSNREFTRTLGKVLRRPTFLPMPRVALWLLFGELTNVLLGSQHARPQRLLEAGFEFEHANLEGALRSCLSK